MENKVKFNLSHVHYAKLTEGDTTTYEKPVPIPGAVKISLEPNGEPESFYADGGSYYTINNNMGYDGDLEIAMIPESFRKDILQEREDKNKVLVEDSGSETKNFALLFEFDGDQKKIRYVLYNCSAGRPKIEGQTNEESREVQTETLSIKARPIKEGLVKSKTGKETTEETYKNWYQTVYMPTHEGEM